VPKLQRIRPSTAFANSARGQLALVARCGRRWFRILRESTGRSFWARFLSTVRAKIQPDDKALRWLIHDRDAKAHRRFRRHLPQSVHRRDRNTDLERRGPTPSQERWVRTVKRRSLDWLVIFSRRHFENRNRPGTAAPLAGWLSPVACWSRARESTPKALLPRFA
jgi:hypothetical protein